MECFDRAGDFSNSEPFDTVIFDRTSRLLSTMTSGASYRSRMTGAMNSSAYCGNVEKR